MMHDTTPEEVWNSWISLITDFAVVLFGVCCVVGLLIAPLWFQFKNRKREIGAPENYTFKNHIKWLFEGIWGDLWKFMLNILKFVGIIVGIALAIAIIYLTFNAISSGINQISVKGVLIIIAVLLALIYFKK